MMMELLASLSIIVSYGDFSKHYPLVLRQEIFFA